MDEKTGDDIDQAEENFDAYGTMRPFNQENKADGDYDLKQKSIFPSGILNGEPIEDDMKPPVGHGLVRAKKLR